MIFEYTFPFGVSAIQIKSSDQIEKKILDNLSTILDSFQFEFNNNLLNSSAYTLNTAQAGLSAFVKSEFINYIQFNLNYVKRYGGKTNPFKIKDKVVENPEDFYEISNSQNLIVKKDNINFDASQLNRIYVIEKINEFLVSQKIKSYLFIYEGIQSSFGKFRWNSDFYIPEIKDRVKIKLHNEYALSTSLDSDYKERTRKFAVKEELLYPVHIILIGKDLNELRDISLEFNTPKYKFEFDKFAKSKQIKLILLDQNKELVHFE